jgi:hypothetical protein
VGRGRLLDEDRRSDMLTVTAPARELLRSIDTGGLQGLRLEPAEDGGLGFMAGPPRPDDQVVEDAGQEVLRIAGGVSEQLDGHSLDRVDTAEGPGLAISSPNEPVPMA